MKHTAILPDTAPSGLLAAILLDHDREGVEAITEALIAALDAIDGDPDIEEDDPSGQCDEDGVNTNQLALLGKGPGCLISDNDHGLHTGC